MALGQQLKDAREKLKLTTSEVAAATRMKVQLVEDLEKEDFSRISAPVYGKGFIKLFAECVKVDPQPLVEEYVDRFVNPQAPQLSGMDDDFAPQSADIRDETITVGNEEPLDDDPFQREERQGSKEPDLFSYQETQPAPSKPDSGSENSIKKRAIEVGNRHISKFRDKVQKAQRQRAADAAAQEAGIEPSRDSSPRSSAPSLPIRGIALVIGIAIVLVFIISMASKCGTSHQGEDPPIPTPPVEQPVEVAVEPQPPYID